MDQRRLDYIIIKKNVSREIEDFVETHPCKVRGIRRSRVLCDVRSRVLKSLLRGTSATRMVGG